MRPEMRINVCLVRQFSSASCKYDSSTPDITFFYIVTQHERPATGRRGACAILGVPAAGARLGAAAPKIVSAKPRGK
ncbi:hypothetical protein E2C01_021143 [Portunus trituberculatus]|uniref:Uncharacterized protein n=1 Tax=Portunus trituberculatus TaxID=210409 RepID=A0A5B7E1V3_PORTR|nr:hypothetical protein [Portunus trituberculatus]